MRYKSLIEVVIFLVICMAVIVYAANENPSEFGTSTTTTCFIGGSQGIVNCTGNGYFGGSVNVSKMLNASNVSAHTYLNASGALDWIKPENILDIDDEDIEGDLNTYVDIAGDNMTGDLKVGPALNYKVNLSTTGDVNATKFYGAFIGNSDTCTALDSDPNDCSANQFADAIAANGDLTCNAIVDDDVPNDITIDFAVLNGSIASLASLNVSNINISSGLNLTRADMNITNANFSVNNLNSQFFFNGSCWIFRAGATEGRICS